MFLNVQEVNKDWSLKWSQLAESRALGLDTKSSRDKYHELKFDMLHREERGSACDLES